MATSSNQKQTGLEAAIERFLDMMEEEADSLTRKEQGLLDMLSTPTSDARPNGSSGTSDNRED